MSSQLNEQETQAQSPMEMPDEGREITVTFKISGEAIEALAPTHVSERSFASNVGLVLACGLYTELAQLRDAQHKFIPPDGHPSTVRQVHQLKAAGRYAALAITAIEQVAVWAQKARDRRG